MVSSYSFRLLYAHIVQYKLPSRGWGGVVGLKQKGTLLNYSNEESMGVSWFKKKKKSSNFLKMKVGLFWVLSYLGEGDLGNLRKEKGRTKGLESPCCPWVGHCIDIMCRPYAEWGLWSILYGHQTKSLMVSTPCFRVLLGLCSVTVSHPHRESLVSQMFQWYV